MANKPKTIAAYMNRRPDSVRRLLHRMDATIRKAAPKAQPTISYGIPAYRLDGILVWFAAHKTHIGFYPGSAGIKAFKTELKPYKYAKGSVQFPIGKPLPLRLITRMVKFRVREQLARQKRA
jgi:uncharacterized protein YdhG (YjbR/CyaY superfamily)